MSPTLFPPGLRRWLPVGNLVVTLCWWVSGGPGSRAATPESRPSGAPTRVVINEVMYHPPDDRDELQWVELLNAGPEPVELAGWSLRKGLKFTLTNSLALAPGKALVISRDQKAFQRHYGTNLSVVGNFGGRLNHDSEDLELVDRTGRVVDVARYATSTGWPLSPDGLSASLERIVALHAGDDPSNWAPSALPERRRAAGSPGQPNPGALTNLPPTIAEVQFAPPQPGAPLSVSARVNDPDGLRSVRLVYQVWPLEGAGSRGAPVSPAEAEVAMAPSPGKPEGTYVATLPALPEGRLVRFRIRATDLTGAERWAPHPDDLRPDWTVYVGRNPNDARIPQVSLIQWGAPERPGPNLRNAFGPGGRSRAAAAGEPTRGQATMVYFPTNQGPPVVRDHIRVTPRAGGWKVRLAKDQLLDGMSTVNVIFESQPRFVLAEHLAYELYRAAGCAAPASGHWRVTFNGRPLGYYLYVEQPNSQFLRRHGFDTKGELFKLLWYGGDLVGQHEKKNHPETGHRNLVETVEALRKTSGEAQWRVIQERFDVDSFVNYYAVNQCLQNWDGFFNNYFLYRHPGPRGKWVILPWDEDKTWGDYDGASPKRDWYEMPLTFGMNGDHPPRGLSSFFAGGGPHGGPMWWRSPGWFSGPLLANPQFRSRFIARLRELCLTTFTPDRLEIPIARMETQLEPEVRFRAGLGGRNPNARSGANPGAPADDAAPAVAAALANFRQDIASFRNQALHRREFLQRELAHEPGK